IRDSKKSHTRLLFGMFEAFGISDTFGTSIYILAKEEKAIV
ncbi:6289_t:CDS:1, partial [Dentiscutata heterogama]